MFFSPSMRARGLKGKRRIRARVLRERECVQVWSGVGEENATGVVGNEEELLEISVKRFVQDNARTREARRKDQSRSTMIANSKVSEKTDGNYGGKKVGSQFSRISW